MKRLFLGVLLALAAVTASPAMADPPATNKNTSVFTFSCTRGSTEAITFQAVGIAQSLQIAGQLLDGTAVVVFVRIVFNGQVVFEVPGQLDRPDLWSCTVAEVPGATFLVFFTPRH
jgi:hypothetical protein